VPDIGLRIAKLSMNFGSDLLFPAYTHAMEMRAMTYGNDENMEGIRAFLEKRKPDYREYRKSTTGASS
jgi:naphthoate synthase/2-ketocyclohexanecarboxyl-CoA hydrolase